MNKTAYLQFGNWGGPYQTIKAQGIKETEAPRNRSITGYGHKIPTSYMIKYLNIWRRVYCATYSNNGTTWCTVNGKEIVVTID